jgi:hypothetical protein
MQFIGSIVMNNISENNLQTAVFDNTKKYIFFSGSKSGLTQNGLIVIIDTERFIQLESILIDTGTIFGSTGSTEDPYLYFTTIDGKIWRRPTAIDFLLSGLSGNTPGNLDNNITDPDIDYKGQVVQLQRNDQGTQRYFYALRVKGTTGSEISDQPIVIHTRFKVHPK